MSFAAEATVQLDPAPAEAPSTTSPPPLALNTPGLLYRMTAPESEMTPGPLIHAAAPVDGVETSDAILDNYSAEPESGTDHE